MSVEKIITDWKQKKFGPVYWLEGEESFYIDQLVEYAEHHILSEAEAGFNLSVFYGRDANWADLINACRRYPMFSDKQVVILKEAQQMRDIDKLEGYIEHPLSSTVLVVAHKEKKLDGRSKLSRLLKQHAVVLSTKKLYENQLPEWVNEQVQKKGFTISRKAVMLLVEHIGNDMSRINNEVDKLLLNLGSRKSITEEDIEQYVGVSKEYNVFELQEALQRKDAAKAIRIIQYFGSNPKAAPIQMILPALYGFFSKVYLLFGVPSQDEKTAAAATGINTYFIKDYMLTAKNYGYAGIEQALLLLHEYNLRSVGVHDAGTEDASLMKEMVWKIMQ
ncbi:DNA polymerase III subunit delta [Agriterribacter sp.]|uniref:DNA polymerase III subunit delta n=1 Tax=Agriterribacter sp. TaxID=2821509 RepID=UPI002BF5CAA5|nr:DNA polymerase III subunit delta [Agriterribacter sp.]HRO47037.1 DNA polymerase III subunit delta [Agriterribacter sp.]HRQ17811.1 DNA polymerase III subunit delta [Agriterribacter sp.]